MQHTSKLRVTKGHDLISQALLFDTGRYKIINKISLGVIAFFGIIVMLQFEFYGLL